MGAEAAAALHQSLPEDSSAEEEALDERSPEELLREAERLPGRDLKAASALCRLALSVSKH